MSKTRQIIKEARANPGAYTNVDLCRKFATTSTFVSRVARENNLQLSLANNVDGPRDKLTITPPKAPGVWQTLQMHADIRNIRVSTLCSRLIEVAARENIVDAILDDGAGK